MLVTSIFSISTIFSKGYFLKVVKSWDCAVKNLETLIARTSVTGNNLPFNSPGVNCGLLTLISLRTFYTLLFTIKSSSFVHGK